MAFCPFRVLPFEPSSLFSLSELSQRVSSLLPKRSPKFPQRFKDAAGISFAPGAERGHLSNRCRSRRGDPIEVRFGCCWSGTILMADPSKIPSPEPRGGQIPEGTKCFRLSPADARTTVLQSYLDLATWHPLLVSGHFQQTHRRPCKKKSCNQEWKIY